MWVYYYKNWSHSWTYNPFFFYKHPILGSKHLNYLDFKSAAYIIKNKEHLNEDGLGLEQILELKRRITSLYSNKAMNNHSV